MVFPKYRKEMKGLPWGIFFNEYGSNSYDSVALETRIVELMEDEESILIIKTQGGLFEKVKNRITELHTYDLPEIVAFNITNANKSYLNWIDKETIKPF